MPYGTVGLVPDVEHPVKVELGGEEAWAYPYICFCQSCRTVLYTQEEVREHFPLIYTNQEAT